MRIREFHSGAGGGGGGQGLTAKKTVWTTFFFVFFSPELILQLTEGVKWFYYRENYTFLRIQRGSAFSRGRGPTFLLC